MLTPGTVFTDGVSELDYPYLKDVPSILKTCNALHKKVQLF